MIGRTISHYRILEQIGAGGMGVVYRAHDERLDRDVALKVLSPTLAEDQNFLARFRREARALSRLNHPNVATVHDFDSEGETSFLVMEFIQGSGLIDKIKSGPLSEKELLRLSLQLLDGLAAAHAERIIHRDLKPGNLRETRDGWLKILDFGLARTLKSDLEATESVVTTSGLVGTLPYMAPEQLRGEPADVRTDIYSTGVVMYELATGQRPFPENFGPKLIDNILHQTPPSPRELNPLLSVRMESVIRRALQKEPGERYPSAAAMREDLQRSEPARTDTRDSATADVPSQTPPLEIAHVLFTDIVGYSKLAMDSQQRQLSQLQKLVRSTAEFERARSNDRLISLPTGDGMALVFFGEPEAPARCAIQLSKSLRLNPEIQLRMGVNSGPVYRVADINTNRNVAGGGINIAQRVMDCGDAGHILVSKSVADVLGQLSAWNGQLHDLGEAEVKHGLRVHIYNLHTPEAGNPQLPEKLKVRSGEQRKTIALPQKNTLIVATSLMAAVAIVVLGLWVWRGRTTGKHAFRSTVAVVGFKNQTAMPETEWVSTSLSEILAAELAAGDFVVPTSAESVARMKIDLAIPNEATYAADTLQKIHRSLHCDYVVYGAFFDAGKSGGGRIRLDLQLQRTATGEVLIPISETGTEVALPELAARVGAALRTKLGMPGVSRSQSAELQAGVPSTSEASRQYFQGLGQLRGFDLLGAKESLTKATVTDPNFSLAHAYLAEAWKGLGYDQKAEEEAKSAFELSIHLGREDKTLVEARYREISSDWDKAIDLYRSIWTLYPENPEYAIRATDVQIRGGKANEALKTIALLREQPEPISQDPRLDLKEAEAADALSDFAKEKQMGLRAADGARKRGSRLLEAEALWRACSAMAALGEVPGARSACDQSIELAKPVGDLLLVARGFTILGRISNAQGEPKQGLEQHRQALKFARDIGSRRDVAGALTNIGNILSNQNDLAGAQKNYEDAIAVAQEINDQGQILSLLNNLATISQTLGKFSVALRQYQQSLDAARAVHDQGSEARARNNMGIIYLLQGNFPLALDAFHQAINSATQTGNRSDQAQFLYSLGDTNIEQGDLDAAEHNYQTGLRLARDLGEKSTIALGQLSISGLRLENERVAEADVLARQAAEEFHSEGLMDLECTARNIIASALMELDRNQEAARELSVIGQSAPQDPTIRLAVAITNARVQMRSGNSSSSKTQLESVVKEASRLGLPGLQFEARLALGELAFFGGSKQTALSSLSTLERDASRKGFRQMQAKVKRVAAQIKKTPV
jgi:serine/threonine protein kinase/tetratricopeptide (TPR) repeat protein